MDRDRRDAADIFFHFAFSITDNGTVGTSGEMDPVRAHAIVKGERDDDWLVRKVASIREYGRYDGASAMQSEAAAKTAGKFLAHGLFWAIANIPVREPPKRLEP
jgi:hypothetical protein